MVAHQMEKIFRLKLKMKLHLITQLRKQLKIRIFPLKKNLKNLIIHFKIASKE